ncbi:MAG: hypothetical protein NTZ13_04185 [Candidatus Parcubacteria bacterium]|nr:hypothetical protein [Candidatus Parcubacteria bacterium]
MVTKEDIFLIRELESQIDRYLIKNYCDDKKIKKLVILIIETMEKPVKELLNKRVAEHIISLYADYNWHIRFFTEKEDLYVEISATL